MTASCLFSAPSHHLLAIHIAAAKRARRATSNAQRAGTTRAQTAAPVHSPARFRAAAFARARARAMAARPAGTVPIAPSGGSGASDGDGGPRARRRAVAGTDIVFANGQAFNGRGYRVCGVANQRGTLCGRIGTCPFHAGRTPGAPPSGRVPKRRRVGARADPVPADTTALDSAAPSAPAPAGSSASIPDCVRRMDAPPTKSRFKRSWTPAEHRQFLASMKKFGKGKWKEIAREVKTRTANQCQSHAQKYFLRQAKSDSERKKKSIHDLTELDDAPPVPSPPLPVAPVSPPKTEMTLAIPPPLPLHSPAQTTSEGPAKSPTIFVPPSPSVYLTQDNHPGLQAVDALASVALATAPNSSHTERTPAERSRAISAVISAALNNVSSPVPPTSARSDGASHVSTARGENQRTEPYVGTGAEDEDGEEEVNATTSSAGAPASAPNVALAAAVQAAANAQMQALAQAAQVAIAAGGAANGAKQSPPNGNGAASAMMSALMSNPQAFMLLNPLLANMGGMAGATGATAGAASAPSQQRLRVTVHVNGKKGGGMAMILPESNTMRDFFKMAKETLHFEERFQRVFTRSGGEITSLDQMVQDDALWLSRGEEFATPA